MKFINPCFISILVTIICRNSYLRFSVSFHVFIFLFIFNFISGIIFKLVISYYFLQFYSLSYWSREWPPFCVLCWCVNLWFLSLYNHQIACSYLMYQCFCSISQLPFALSSMIGVEWTERKPKIISSIVRLLTLTWKDSFHFIILLNLFCTD